jgi:hypothetical protein
MRAYLVTRARAVAVAMGIALSACDSGSNVLLTTAPGVSVPNGDQLAAKLDSASRTGAMKLYVRENGKLVEVKPSGKAKPASAVVRSFDPKTGLAYVDIDDYPQYSTPLFQVWRFDGKTWSDSIDPGIFAR